ncbi:MAG: ATP-binding protein, partial [Acidobacteria bacterium]|nr:ATP-binding protein [Acidobacteriota bacterium]
MSTRRVLVSDRSAPGVARRLVREVAAGLPYAVIERAELAVSELVTNAVRHGSEPGSNIDVVIDRSGEQLAIVV